MPSPRRASAPLRRRRASIVALCGLGAGLIGCGGIALREDETASPGPPKPDAAAAAVDGGDASKLAMLLPETQDLGRVCGDATFEMAFENSTKSTRYLKPYSPDVSFAPTDVLVKPGESVTIQGTVRRSTAPREGRLADVRIAVDGTETFRVEVRGMLLRPKSAVRFQPAIADVPGVSYSVLVANEGDADLVGNLVLPAGGALRHEQGGYVVPFALTAHTGKVARFVYAPEAYGKQQVPLELVLPSEGACDETTPRTVISVERRDDRVLPPEEPVNLGSSGCGTRTSTKQLVLGSAPYAGNKPLLYAESKTVTVRAAGSASRYFSPGDPLEIFADVAPDGTVGERAEVVLLRESNDGAGIAWRLPVKYTATGVAVVVAPTSPVDFGEVAVGNVARRTVSVQAIGAGRVRLSPVFTMEGADFSSALSFSHDGFPLEAGGPAESTVLLFAPKRAGALQGTFGVRGVVELGANCGVRPATVPLRGIGN